MNDIQIFHSLEDFATSSQTKPTHVTLGVFDGIHRGHQELIKRTVETARDAGTLPMVFTFSNHPLSVLAPAYVPPVLTTDDIRSEIFSALGIKAALFVKFDQTLANLSPSQFATRILQKHLKASLVVCGYNFCFGRGGAGNVSFLCDIGKSLGFSVEHVPPVKIGNIIVSSTRIRELLSQGRVDAAAEFLGRPYALRGSVVKGAGRGRGLGYPTANLSFSENLLIPHTGIYAVHVIVEGKTYQAMMNIGYNPTFPPEHYSTEVHLFDFQTDLVGKNMEIKFIKRLRDEMRFETKEALVEQLRMDEKTVREILSP